MVFTRSTMTKRNPHTNYLIFNEGKKGLPIQLLALIFSFLSKEDFINLILNKKTKQGLLYLLSSGGPKLYHYDRIHLNNGEAKLRLKLDECQKAFTGGAFGHYPFLLSIFSFALYSAVNLVSLASKKGAVCSSDIGYYAALSILAPFLVCPIPNLIAEYTFYYAANKAIGPEWLYDALPDVGTRLRFSALQWQKNLEFNEQLEKLESQAPMSQK